MSREEITEEDASTAVASLPPPCSTANTPAVIVLDVDLREPPVAEDSVPASEIYSVTSSESGSVGVGSTNGAVTGTGCCSTTESDHLHHPIVKTGFPLSSHSSSRSLFLEQAKDKEENHGEEEPEEGETSLGDFSLAKVPSSSSTTITTTTTELEILAGKAIMTETTTTDNTTTAPPPSPPARMARRGSAVSQVESSVAVQAAAIDEQEAEGGPANDDFIKLVFSANPTTAITASPAIASQQEEASAVVDQPAADVDYPESSVIADILDTTDNDPAGQQEIRESSEQDQFVVSVLEAALGAGKQLHSPVGVELPCPFMSPEGSLEEGERAHSLSPKKSLSADPVMMEETDILPTAMTTMTSTTALATTTTTTSTTDAAAAANTSITDQYQQRPPSRINSSGRSTPKPVVFTKTYMEQQQLRSQASSQMSKRPPSSQEESYHTKRARSRSPVTAPQQQQQHQSSSMRVDLETDVDYIKARVFVGNLRHAVREPEIRHAFSKFGPILSVIVKGKYALVQFTKEQHAQTAIMKSRGYLRFNNLLADVRPYDPNHWKLLKEASEQGMMLKDGKLIPHLPHFQRGPWQHPHHSRSRSRSPPPTVHRFHGAPPPPLGMDGPMHDDRRRYLEHAGEFSPPRHFPPPINHPRDMPPRHHYENVHQQQQERRGSVHSEGNQDAAPLKKAPALRDYLPVFTNGRIPDVQIFAADNVLPNFVYDTESIMKRESLVYNTTLVARNVTSLPEAAEQVASQGVWAVVILQKYESRVRRVTSLQIFSQEQGRSSTKEYLSIQLEDVMAKLYHARKARMAMEKQRTPAPKVKIPEELKKKVQEKKVSPVVEEPVPPKANVVPSTQPAAAAVPSIPATLAGVAPTSVPMVSGMPGMPMNMMMPPTMDPSMMAQMFAMFQAQQQMAAMMAFQQQQQQQLAKQQQEAKDEEQAKQQQQQSGMNMTEAMMKMAAAQMNPFMAAASGSGGSASMGGMPGMMSSFMQPGLGGAMPNGNPAAGMMNPMAAAMMGGAGSNGMQGMFGNMQPQSDATTTSQPSSKVSPTSQMSMQSMMPTMGMFGAGILPQQQQHQQQQFPQNAMNPFGNGGMNLGMQPSLATTGASSGQTSSSTAATTNGVSTDNVAMMGFMQNMLQQQQLQQQQQQQKSSDTNQHQHHHVQQSSNTNTANANANPTAVTTGAGTSNGAPSSSNPVIDNLVKKLLAVKK